MRVSREQAKASRLRIVDKAAELFRARGFDGIGIADLMKACGMTQGGFYRHFASKDDLAKEAASKAYQELNELTEGRSTEALLTQYISPGHRDDLAGGCPSSALGTEAMRQTDTVKSAFAAGVETWLGLIDAALAAEHNSADSVDRRRLAIDLAARAVGAIVLARASSSNAELSDEILRTCLSESLDAAGSRHLGRE